MSIYSKTTSALPGVPRHFGLRLGLAAGGSVVVLAAVVGGAIWYRSDGTSSKLPETVAAPVTSGITISHPSAAYTPHTIYMVRSEEQAAVLSVNLNEANSIRQSSGEPPLLDEVVVVNSDEEAAGVFAAQDELNRVLAAQFLPENVVTDLRQTSFAPAAAPMASTTPYIDPEPKYDLWVYIVGSEAEADQIRIAAASVPGVKSEVMVANSREEANALAFELGSNLARQSDGEPLIKAVVAGSLASGK